MSINSQRLYDNFIFLNGTEILWSIDGILPGDLLAGMTVAAFRIVHDMIHIFKRNDAANLMIKIRNKYDPEINIPLRNIDDMATVLSSYIGQYHIEVQDMNKFLPDPELIGWWIKDIVPEMYYLFQFRSVDFIQGFISGCNAFTVDFRDYIAGAPFIYINNNKIPMNVDGYDIAPFNMNKRVPAPIGAFYTGAHEADAYGEDYD